MKKITVLLLGSYLLLGGLGVAAAQEMPGPPKVFSVVREFVKPGKGGALHEKTESAFVQAMAHAKWPTHYFAVSSITGKPRVLFLTGYDSFEAWEKDVQATQKNATLSAAIDRAAVGGWRPAERSRCQRIDVSRGVQPERTGGYRPHALFRDLPYRVRAGHDGDWEAIIKMVKRRTRRFPTCIWPSFMRSTARKAIPMSSSCR